jgi:hypothetical protein
MHKEGHRINASFKSESKEPFGMDRVATFVEYYLPVFIPVFLTIISVLSGIVTKRIQLTLPSLLKIHSDMVLGLFSFVIWALVAYQQTGVILLNRQHQLSLIRVVLLLFANIILLIAGQIVLNATWDVNPTWENYWNGAFLLLTLVAVCAPIDLAIPYDASVKAGASQSLYRVAVIYQDTSLPKAGPKKLAGLQLCAASTQNAPDRQTAASQAVEEFKKSDKGAPARGDAGSIFVDQSQAIAERQQ